METRLHLSIGTSPVCTQMLLRLGRQERLRAVLPPACGVPSNSCRTFLATLASWFNQPLHVALVADSHGHFQELGLSGLYTVDGVQPPVEVHLIKAQDRLALQLYGAGSFERLRRISRQSITDAEAAAEEDRPW